MKTLPRSLIVSIVVGLVAGPSVITTAKPPSFDPNVAKPSVYIKQSAWWLSIHLVLILALRLIVRFDIPRTQQYML